MLIGEYKHTLDSKKRLSLPASLRKELGKRVVITRGFENCLFVYPSPSWRKVVDKLEALPWGSAQTRGVARFILAGAIEEEVDSVGRVLIPDYLKEFAHITSKVALLGVSNRLEVWDTTLWEEYRKKVEVEASRMAQTLGEIGRF
jgi:MraZ protein